MMGRPQKTDVEYKIHAFLQTQRLIDEFTVADVAEFVGVARDLAWHKMQDMSKSGRLHRSGIGGKFGNEVYYQKGPAPKVATVIPIQLHAQPDLWNVMANWSDTARFAYYDKYDPETGNIINPANGAIHAVGRWYHIICDIFTARNKGGYDNIRVASSLASVTGNTIGWSSTRGGVRGD